LSEGGEGEGRDDAEVVVAALEGFEEEWVGFGGNLEDQTSACYELMARYDVLGMSKKTAKACST